MIQNNNNNHNYKFIDLFAGTGAFSYALEKNNKFECVFANDMVKSSKQIYELNNPTHSFTLQDLNTINVDNIPSHNILCGGFPCQPFSNGGKKKTFNDERGLLFDEIMQIAKYKKPKFMFLESQDIDRTSSEIDSSRTF